MIYTIEQFFGEDIIYLAMLFAIPTHLLVMATFLKFRKTTFAGSYFVLSCSLLISDTLMCATKIVFNLLMRTPMGPGIIINGTETLILWDQAIYSSLSIFFRTSNQWALLIIALNRFIFVCFPSNAQNLWTWKITMFSVIGQWAIGLLFGMMFQPQMLMIRDPVTGVEGVVPNINQGKFWSVVVGISNTGSIIVIFCLYSIMFCHFRAHRKRMSELMGNNGSTQQNGVTKTEIQLAFQAIVLSLFLLPEVILSILMLVLPPPPMDTPMTAMPVSQTFTYLTNHVECANYYSTSFVMLIMTKTIRNHVRKFIAGSAVDPVTLDHTSTMNRNRRQTRGISIK